MLGSLRWSAIWPSLSSIRWPIIGNTRVSSIASHPHNVSDLLRKRSCFNPTHEISAPGLREGGKAGYKLQTEDVVASARYFRGPQPLVAYF